MTLISEENEPVFEGHLPPVASAPVNHTISLRHHTEIIVLHHSMMGFLSAALLLARGIDCKVFHSVLTYIVLCISVFRNGRFSRWRVPTNRGQLGRIKDHLTTVMTVPTCWGCVGSRLNHSRIKKTLFWFLFKACLFLFP